MVPEVRCPVKPEAHPNPNPNPNPNPDPKPKPNPHPHPKVRCPVKPEAGALNLWKRKFFHTTRPVAARGDLPAAGDERCNWCPPRECWRVEHVTPLELEAEIASREAEVASPGTDGAGEAAAGLAGAEATAWATAR